MYYGAVFKIKKDIPVKMKARLILFFCCLVFTLVVVEASLRLALPESYYIWPPHLRWLFRPDPTNMPGISGESRFEINSIGLRGDELTSSHTYRILAIGGSTTECLYLDQLKAWPYLLQAALNDGTYSGKVWVGNAGMSGRTTRHHLVAMQYLPIEKMRIDTIIFLIGINDFQEYLAASHLPSKSAEQLLDETFRGGLRHSKPDAAFFRRTAIWRLLRSVKTGLLQKANRYKVHDKSGNVSWENGDQPLFPYKTWREHRRRASEIRTELPDITPGLKDYADNINRLITIANQKSVRLIFMTQPTMWRSDLPDDLKALLWFGGVGDFQNEIGKPYYSVEALANGMKQYNDVLLTICRQRGIECIDLSYLPKDTTVFYDDVHFNESGALKISRVIASQIRRRY